MMAILILQALSCLPIIDPYLQVQQKHYCYPYHMLILVLSYASQAWKPRWSRLTSIQQHGVSSPVHGFSELLLIPPITIIIIIMLLLNRTCFFDLVNEFMIFQCYATYIKHDEKVWIYMNEIAYRRFLLRPLPVYWRMISICDALSHLSRDIPLIFVVCDWVRCGIFDFLLLRRPWSPPDCWNH